MINKTQVSKASEDVQLEAVKQNGLAIHSIYDPSEAVKKAASK